MNTKHIIILSSLGIAFVLGVAAYIQFSRTPQTPVAETPEIIIPSEETTPVATSTTKKTLPPEYPFILPAGAISLDDYAFTLGNEVQFRSLTSTSSMTIPGADAKTFVRLTDFALFPGRAVVSDCGASGNYAFYEDKEKMYFYQYWRTPLFRASRVEVIKDATVGGFKRIDATHVFDGTRVLTIKYVRNATTCSLTLEA